MTKALQFLSLVQTAARQRSGPADYIHTALRISGKLPDELPAEEAAAIFLRCLFEEQPIPLREQHHDAHGWVDATTRTTHRDRIQKRNRSMAAVH